MLRNKRVHKVEGGREDDVAEHRLTHVVALVAEVGVADLSGDVRQFAADVDGAEQLVHYEALLEVGALHDVGEGEAATPVVGALHEADGDHVLDDGGVDGLLEAAVHLHLTDVLGDDEHLGLQLLKPAVAHHDVLPVRALVDDDGEDGGELGWRQRGEHVLEEHLDEEEGVSGADLRESVAFSRLNSSTVP